MLFNSPEFIFVFLPLALIGLYLLGRFGHRSAIGWLTLCSVVFYAQWRPKYVVVLVGSILANYLISRMIAAYKEKPRLQHWALIAGVVGNLSALCFFKYLFPALRFFSDIGLGHHHRDSIALPLGISFFTFTQLGYLIDLKQGEAEPQGLVSYALFVTFFPHLIAGPILHHKEIMPQFARERRYGLNREDFSVGLTWFIMGLFKKVMIADMIASYAVGAFTDPAHQTIPAAWLGAITYMLQLYFDFSGYSDMAIGLARMFSIRFPFNFNSPYKAASVIEFWSRWHMTLTRYITLYIYTPISMAVSRARITAGKKISSKATKTLEGFTVMVAYPTIVAMFLAGVWHGAGLQFMIFGLIHGVTMTLEHAWNLFRPSKHSSPSRLVHLLSVARVNVIVMVGFIFFHANSMRVALALLSAMLGVHASPGFVAHRRLLAVLLLLPVVWLLPNTQQILGETETGKDTSPAPLGIRWKPGPVWALAIGCAFFCVLIYMSASTTFLYFQF